MYRSHVEKNTTDARQKMTQGRLLFIADPLTEF